MAQIGAEVHISPRARQAATAARMSLADSGSLLRADVDLVLVGVTVLDRDDRAVSGLRSSSFVVLENKVPQPIRYFSQDDMPLSVVLVLDTSGSMADKMEYARRAALEFLNASNAGDEIAVVTVASQPRVKNMFGDSLSQIRETVDYAQADGTTSLWDSVYVGMQRLRSASLSRKAMVIISDGGDNSSRFTEGSLRRMLQEADVQVYGIGFFDSFPRTQEAKRGPLWLEDVTNATGGRLLIAHDAVGATAAALKISDELRSQYVLGYYPRDSKPGGKWRNIKVQIKSDQSSKLRLYAKKGYYSSAN